jgi:hypothetical protein
MRKGFLIYEEMRKYFPIYEEGFNHILLCNCSFLNFLIYETNFLFFFYQCIIQLATLENRKNTDYLVCSPVENKYIYTAQYKVPAFYRVSNLDNMILVAGIL